MNQSDIDFNEVRFSESTCSFSRTLPAYSSFPADSFAAFAMAMSAVKLQFSSSNYYRTSPVECWLICIR